MYSAVLMLALTAGSETVDFGRNRCNGGGNAYGCSSSVVVGCSASSGCSSSGHGGLFARRGHGCSGSAVCSGGGVVGGCSSSYANCGRSGLFGGGLFGGHHRGGCSNGSACSNGYACSGSVVGTGCSSGCTSGTVVVPSTTDKKPLPKTEPVPQPKKTTQSAAPATIIVSLPADARLFVDGASTTSTSDRRTLVTPELAFGTTYAYTMRVEIVRDGQVQSQSQQVNVIAGQTATVQFNLSSQGVASR